MATNISFEARAATREGVTSSGTDLYSLEGKVALVTDGNGGLGKAIALGLRSAGARVTVTGRNADKNAGARELGDRSVLTMDAGDEAAVQRTIAIVVERFGRLDILVNNAGQFAGGSVLQMTLEDWNAVVTSHLTGTLLCSKHAARAMVERRQGGKIVNIGAICSIFDPLRYANYAAAKTGVVGLTRALAVELAAHRIQVNAILPGWVNPLARFRLPRPAREIRWRTPAERWGEAADLVGPVVFLSSSASDFVTGTALPVDGGYEVSDRLLPD